MLGLEVGAQELENLFETTGLFPQRQQRRLERDEEVAVFSNRFFQRLPLLCTL